MGDAYLETVYEPPLVPNSRSPTVDVVAVHGLGANTQWTWTTHDVNWLQDASMLPSIVPTARIMTFGYATQVPSTSKVDSQIASLARQLLILLIRNRTGSELRPLLLLGHSLGGNIIEKAIVDASEDTAYNDVLLSIVGVVFLGTPHRGSTAQPTELLLARFFSFLGHTGSSLFLSLKSATGITDSSVKAFQEVAIQHSIRCYCFYELEESDLGLILRAQGWPFPEYKILFVDKLAACLDDNPIMHAGLQRNHFKLNKFSDQGDPDYIKVVGIIKDFLNGAESTSMEAPKDLEVPTA